jgi:hypothetical protein
VADQLACGGASDTVTADRVDPQGIECESLARGDFRDGGPPRLRLTTPRVQRLSRAVRVEAAMDEPGTLRVAGRVLVGGRAAGSLRPTSARPDAPDQRLQLRLRMPRRLARSVRAALASGRAVVASLAATGRDRARNRGKPRRVRARIAR